MTPQILEFIHQNVTNTYVGNVLEVGSFNVNGTVRTALQHLAKSYIGTDITPGNCVDIVIDAEQLLTFFKPKQFDTIVCCECLEHCLHPWLIIEAIRILLKPNGYLWISTPTFDFPEHRFPIDCYRFGIDTYYKYFFKDMEILNIDTVADCNQHHCIVGVARNGLPAHP